MAGLSRRRDSSEDGNRLVISGPLATVTCSTLTDGTPFLIGHHLTRPQHDGDEAHPCDFLGSCYFQAGSGATELRWAWYAAGRDNEVIWRELERRYALLAGEADQ